MRADGSAENGGEEMANKSVRLKKGDLMRRNNRHGYVFIAPFLLGFLVFMLIPIVQSLIFSFNDLKITENGYNTVFQGIGNYRYVLATDIDYRKKLVSAFTGMFRDTMVIIPFSFFTALILSKKFRGRTFARTIFFLPVIVSAGVLFKMDSNNGIMSMMMSRNPTASAGGMNEQVTASALINMLFADALPAELLSFVSEAISGIYDIVIKSGLQIILFISGLNTISPSLYEASDIEGATGWVNFWKITFPMCGPYIVLNVIYTIIDSFTSMGNPLIGRVRSELMSLSNFGRASAAVWLYFFNIFIVLGVLYFLMQRKVFYHE